MSECPEITSPSSRLAKACNTARSILPGLVLSVVVAGMALGLAVVMGNNPVLSPLVIAALLGMVVSNVWRLPPTIAPGSRVAGRSLLRFAIVLLGAQLTIQDLLTITPLTIGSLVVLVVSTFIVIVLIGRVLGIDQRLTRLIGMGTAVCGASAIVAAGTATSADNEDIAYALVCITLFGTLTMLAVPSLAVLLDLDPTATAVWAGASIHEIAQVAGATSGGAEATQEVGMIIKLARVLMLAPMIALLVAMVSRIEVRGQASGQPLVPGFILLLLLFMLVNSIFTLPPELTAFLSFVSKSLMTVALAGLGLSSRFAKMWEKGWSPLLLSCLGTLFIGAGGFAIALLVP